MTEEVQRAGSIKKNGPNPVLIYFEKKPSSANFKMYLKRTDHLKMLCHFKLANDRNRHSRKNMYTTAGVDFLL